MPALEPVQGMLNRQKSLLIERAYLNGLTYFGLEDDKCRHIDGGRLRRGATICDLCQGSDAWLVLTSADHFELFELFNKLIDERARGWLIHFESLASGTQQVIKR